MSDAHAAGSQHPRYMVVAVVLLVLTVLSFFVSERFHSPVLTAFVVLSVAVVKATLVAMFFMHAKFEGTWLYVLTVPVVVLGVVLFLALFPDVVFLHR